MQQEGNQAPNIPDAADRVINKEELARMERYVAELQSAEKWLKAFKGPSGGDD